MTALNLFCQGDCAYLAADTAVTDQDGILLSRRPKVLELPRAHLAIAWTGRAPMPHGGLKACGGAAGRRLSAALLSHGVDVRSADQDTVLRSLPAALQTMHAENWEDYPEGSPELLSLSVVAAAWREGGGPAVFMAQTEDQPGVPAYALVRLHQYVTAPLDTQDGGAAFLNETVGTADLSDPANFDPQRGSLALLERQRLISKGVCGSNYFSIGGRAILTEVSRRGVSSRVLHRWPDREGKPIRPSRATVETEPRNPAPAKSWRNRLFGAAASTPERIPA